MRSTICKIPPVAVIDGFDRTFPHQVAGLLLSHGESVEAFLGEDVPKERLDTKNFRREVDDKGNPISHYSQAVGMYKRALLELRQSIKAGKKYSAVNLSSGFSIPIEVLGKALCLELHGFNLQENRAIVIQKFAESPRRIADIKKSLLDDSEFIRRLSLLLKMNLKETEAELSEFLLVFENADEHLQVIQLIDELSYLQTPVFEGAGNEGVNFVGLWTFALQAHVVRAGTCDYTEPYSANNNLVTDFARGSFWLAKRRINDNEYVMEVDNEESSKIPGTRIDNDSFSKGIDLNFPGTIIYPSSKLKEVTEKELSTNPFLKSAYIKKWQNPKEVPAYFAVDYGMFDGTIYPIGLRFLDIQDSKFIDSTKFAYSCTGTSFATPTALRNFLIKQNT